jgi:hypothetical protein
MPLSLSQGVSPTSTEPVQGAHRCDPGEVKVFDTDEVHDAKKWLVALDEDDD